MAVTLTNSQLSAGLYSAFWNRAPDYTGQQFWVGQLNNGATPLELANFFYDSDEGRAAYPNWMRDGSVASNEALIIAVYQQVFEREPDAGGLAFWSAQLNSGQYTFPEVVLGMMNSAVQSAAEGNTDGLQFMNEIAVGIYVAETLRTDDPAITSIALDGVTYEYSSVIAREAELAQIPQHTYTLTTSVDRINAEAYSLTTGIVNSNTGAQASTLNPGDHVTGVAGTTEVLSIVDTATGVTTNSGFILNSVETIKVQNDATGAQTFSLANATGVETLVSNYSNGGTTTAFTNVGNLVNAQILNADGTVTITYTDAAVAGTADNMDLVVNAAATAADAALNADGIETVNVIATGAASGSDADNWEVNVNGSKLKAITVAGDQNLVLASTLAGAAGTSTATAGVVNASNATGDLVLDLTASTGHGASQYLNVAGGAGDDVYGVDVLNKNITISGGAGFDALAVNSLAGGSNDFTNTTQFEAIEFLGATAGNINLTNAGDVELVVFDGASTASLQGVNGGIAVQLMAAANTLTVDVTGAAGATDDVVTVVVGDELATTVINAGSVAASNIETLNLESLSKTGKVTGSNVVTLTDAAASTLNIAGNESVEVTMGSGVLTTIDASLATADVNITGIADGAFAAAGASVTGGLGNDTLKGGSGNDLITAGAGNDSISAGDGNDTIDAGAGNDTIDAGAGNDSISGSTGNDYIRFDTAATLSSNDTIDGGDGTDTIGLKDAPAIADTAFKNVSGVETITADSAAATDDLNLTLGSYADAAGFTTISAHKTSAGVVDGAGDVAVTAASTYQNAVSINAGSGADTINFAGTTGSFTLTTKDSWLTTADVVTGGVGTGDSIVIQANGGTANLTNVSGIESVTITANSTAPATTSSALTIGSDSTVVLGEALTVDASALTGSTSTFTFDGSAEVTTGSLAGRFSVTGGNANDTITGGSGNDTVAAGTGDDSVIGGAGNDSIDGGSGNNRLLGGAGNDTITAGAGNDLITGGADADMLSGGAGNDYYNYTTATDSLADNTSTQSFLDTIDGFNAGSGTVATVVDRLWVPAAVTTIGSATVSTASTSTLAASLEANATLAAAAANSAYVVTIANGTAAGTYLAIIGASAGYQASTDTLIKLTNAANLENLTTSNFTVSGPASNIVATYTPAVVSPASPATYSIAGAANGVVAVDATAVQGVTDGGAAVTYSGVYVPASVQTLTLAGVTGGLGSTVSVNGTTNAALASLVGTSGNDNFTFVNADFGAAAVTVDGGSAGVDTVTVTNIEADVEIGGAGDAATFTAIDNLSLTNGTRNLANDATKELTISDGLSQALAVTNASTTAASTVILGDTTGNTYSSASTGNDTVTLGAVTQSATNTGATGTDITKLGVNGSYTGNISFAAGATSTISAVGTAVGTFNLTGATLSNVDTLSTARNGSNALELSQANVAAISAITMNDGGGADTLALGDGTFDFTSKTVTFGVTASVLDLNTVGSGSKTVTVDASDLANVGTITGESTSGAVTTVNLNGTDDWTGLTITNLDVVTIAGSNSDLTLDAAEPTATNLTTITGTDVLQNANLIFAAGTVNLSNSSVSGFDTVTVEDDLTVGASSIVGAVTLVGGGSDLLAVYNGASSTGTVNQDLTNLTLTDGDFDEIAFGSNNVGYTTNLTVSQNALVTGVATITGTASGTENLIVSASTAGATVTTAAVTNATVDSIKMTDNVGGANTLATSAVDEVRLITTAQLGSDAYTDTVVLNNKAVADTSTTLSTTITGFIAGVSGDVITSQRNGVDISDGAFVTTDGSTTIALSDSDVLAIQSTTTFGTLSNATAVLNWLNANGVTADVASTYATIVAYNGAGSAGIYQAFDSSGDQFFDRLELVGVVNAANDSLVAINFA